MYDLIKAKPRTSKKETNNYQLRKSGWVPGVIYGKSIKPSVELQMEYISLHKVLRYGHKIAEVEVENDKKYLVNIQEIQRSPINDRYVHVAFLEVKRGQATETEAKITTTGKSPGVKEGGSMQIVLHEVAISCKPKDIPESIEVDISELKIGDTITLSELKLPPNVKLVEDDLEQVVITCTPPKKEAEEVKPDLEQSEPEVINQKADDSEDSKEEPKK